MQGKTIAVVSRDSTAIIRTPELRTQDRRIQQAVKLLKKNPFAPVRINEIAATLHISRSHLAHLFKRELGIAPTHYVRVLRLRKAKDLLESTFLSVKEIMAVVGFADLSHFVRDYKQEFGETPSQTRASKWIA
ncbi:MAG: cdhR 1 [Candidatus Angelobacter sp.]|nr:cdhR 1 [Candidatus Angelobacter sp.]